MSRPKKRNRSQPRRQSDVGRKSSTEERESERSRNRRDLLANRE